MILGITGGSGSGKTTLLNLLRRCGGLVLDCDAIYHRLLAEDPRLLDAIRTRFPEAFPNGQFDRKRLGSIVFSDSDALADLNAITHRAVKAEVLRLLAQQDRLAAIDAIALFEGGLSELCDVTVAVTAPVELRVARLMTRDGISESYARSRIAAQHSDDWFRNRCSAVLENDSDCASFTRKCIAFLKNNGIIVTD